MSIIGTGTVLFVGLLLVLVISRLISRSRNTTGPYHHYDDGVQSVHHASYLAHSGHADATGQHGGDWGGRDMSSDHHSHSDSGGGGDWGGGDAGGGSDGGGGGGE
jgi:hypothetical protein